MSLSLILQEPDRIFISADTATSSKQGDTIYRLATNGKKIFVVDNQIIFLAGNMDLVGKVMNEYQSQKVRTIECFKDIILKNVNNNPRFKEVDFLLEAIIAVMENDKAVFYNIESPKNYEIERRELTEGIGAYAAGIKNDIAVGKAIKYIQCGKMSVQDIYIKTYEDVAFEGIGGNLTLYCLDKNGIQVLINGSPIVEKNKTNYKTIMELKENILNMILKNNAQMIIAETLIGKIVLTEKLCVGDKKGNLDIVGDLMTCKDNKIIKKINLWRNNNE